MFSKEIVACPPIIPLSSSSLGNRPICALHEILKWRGVVSQSLHTWYQGTLSLGIWPNYAIWINLRKIDNFQKSFLWYYCRHKKVCCRNFSLTSRVILISYVKFAKYLFYLWSEIREEEPAFRRQRYHWPKWAWGDGQSCAPLVRGEPKTSKYLLFNAFGYYSSSTSMVPSWFRLGLSMPLGCLCIVLRASGFNCLFILLIFVMVPKELLIYKFKEKLRL